MLLGMSILTIYSSFACSISLLTSDPVKLAHRVDIYIIFILGQEFINRSNTVLLHKQCSQQTTSSVCNDYHFEVQV